MDQNYIQLWACFHEEAAVKIYQENSTWISNNSKNKCNRLLYNLEYSKHLIIF